MTGDGESKKIGKALHLVLWVCPHWMPALEKFAPLLPFSKIIIVLEQIFE